MKRDYDQIFQIVDRIINMHNQAENYKRCYGLDLPLTFTEIHIIDEIGKTPGIGIRGIARNKGVTEGAISQLVKKLIKKGLVRKQISEESEAKVNLTLTGDGQVCYSEHMKFHENDNQKWYDLLDQLNDVDYTKMKKMLIQIADKSERGYPKEDISG